MKQNGQYNMKRKSNQRITKIKLDSILELLKKAEDTAVEDACTIEPSEDQLTPYPDMDSLRIWTRDYITKGLNKILINKLADDGQTYMTTLIDGLPLFTKMSKTIQGSTSTEVISGFASNITSSNVTLDDKGIATFGSSIGEINVPITSVMKTNATYEVVFTAVDNPGASNDSGYIFEFYNVGIRLYDLNGALRCVDNLQGKVAASAVTLEYNTDYKLTTTLNNYGYVSFNIIKVSDGSSVFSHNNITGQTNYFTSLYFGHRIKNVQIDFTKSSITTSSGTINLLNTSEVYSTGETSKPGLWLSNLIQPVSQSQAGSWLRSNLIHSDNDKYSLINSYVVGNYSNTFTQPAIIQHVEGTSDDQACARRYGWNALDQSTYNQHYSPSLAGCLNYAHNKVNSYIQYGIRDDDYAFWYGSYQTIAFPSDPDMQKYTESDSSCTAYNFTNHDDDGITYNATPYMMKAANSKQRPDIHGKLTLKPDSTTGGSITGELWGTDSDGNHCATNINYIFRSVQAMFSADYEFNSTDNSLDNTTYKPLKAYTNLSTCGCIYHYGLNTSDGKYYLVYGNYRFKYSVGYMGEGRSCRGVAYHDSDDNAQYGFNSGNSAVFFDYDIGATCGRNSTRPSVDYDSNGYCGSHIGRLNGILLPQNTQVSDQSGINIYLHVKDIIAEYIDKDIPFSNPDCTQPAYNVYVNTDGTTSSDYERVYLIAENVSIDSLGNISTINEKIINLE